MGKLSGGECRRTDPVFDILCRYMNDELADFVCLERLCPGPLLGDDHQLEILRGGRTLLEVAHRATQY